MSDEWTPQSGYWTPFGLWDARKRAIGYRLLAIRRWGDKAKGEEAKGEQSEPSFVSEASQLPKATAKQYDKIIFRQKRIGLGHGDRSSGISAIPTPHWHIATHDLPDAILHLLQDQPR